jgi:Mg2+ and Co2+ transporter CorA
LPNVVFGMYGMNIPLPLQENSMALAVILGSTVLAVAAIIILARWRRWF